MKLACITIGLLLLLNGCQKKAEVELQVEEVADYRIRALVMGKKNYRFDELAEALPTDLILGWGPLENRSQAARLMTGQADRRFWWYADPQTIEEIGASNIRESCANTHILPATPEILEKTRKLRPGDHVYLEGALINLRLPNGLEIRTSTRRDDEGDGACEVLLLKKIVPIGD